MRSSVTAVVCTKDRYYTSLPNCLMSIALQTVVPDRLLIYDDGEQKDLRNESLYQNIFSMLTQKGIVWEVKFGARKGQVQSHQSSLTEATTDWIWRIDDDNVMEANVLEKLLENVADDVGAVGGLVLDPKIPLTSHKLASNKIEDIYLGLNIQWFMDSKKQEVDHLYSTFIYRRAEAPAYCMKLSKVGHREETIFTHELKRKGWKLIMDPAAVTWHLREATGGIRSDSDRDMWHHDELIFGDKLKEWGVTPTQVKLCVLDSGLGDHLIFKSILPEIIARHKRVVVACCYREVFEDFPEVELMSIAEAQMAADCRELNIYKKMWDWNWKWSLEDAYRRLYA